MRLTGWQGCLNNRRRWLFSGMGYGESYITGCCAVSIFHQHFRAITTISPLQFQKQLRLIHARRLMLVDGAWIAQAAYTVGYASVSQFTREYARMFGAPPGRDKRMATVRVLFEV